MIAIGSLVLSSKQSHVKRTLALNCEIKFAITVKTPQSDVPVGNPMFIQGDLMRGGVDGFDQ